MLDLVVVSPEGALALVLQEHMASAGWTVRGFASLQEAAAAGYNAGMTLLDLTGTTIIPADTPLPPCLFVIGDPDNRLPIAAVIETFIAPVRLGHLVARLQFHTRLGSQRVAPTTYRLGPFVFAPRDRTATHEASGEIVRLTDKETALLDYLAAAEEPLARENILEAIWGYSAAMDTHTLETHLYRLRRKLATPAMEGIDPFQTEAGRINLHPNWRIVS